MAEFDERFAPLSDIANLSNEERMRNYLLAQMQAQNYSANAAGGKSLLDVGEALIPSGPQVSAGVPWANNLAEKLPGAMWEGVKHAVSVPGVVMQPNPYPEGSESWYWYEDQRSKAMTDWAPGMALNTMGTGAIAGVGIRGGEAVLGAGPVRPKRSTEVPSLRGLPVDEAIAIARKEPHLIKAGDQSEGFYVGAPREMSSRRDLTQARKEFDNYVGQDWRGGDWYDRYRAGVNEVTGGDPVKNRWMTSQEGQWSAGVDPGSELGFSLKENNAAIAGMPVKAGRPAAHEAHMAAIEAQDPSLYMLGRKTGEYQRLITPDQPLPPGATGVNDFRHARNWGYTEASGTAQKNAITGAAHKFLDYETALAVDRANKANLGGRSNWTGEQLQAAPWVRQKALDIQARGGKNPDGSFKLSYEEAFARANRTIADYFDKHTAFATHEAIPGADVTGHMPLSALASAEERAAYSADPRSTWANAPLARDAIYAETGIPGTGVSVRTRPSTEMQGMYTTPAGNTEFNPGWTARPLVAFEAGSVKSVAPADRTILDAGEAIRGYVDAQNAAAWHKPWLGGATSESGSRFFPREGKATPLELMAMKAKMAQHGLTDIVDTGQGITATRFWPPPQHGPTTSGKPIEAVENLALNRAARQGAFKEFGASSPAKVDSNLIDYVDAWKAGEGSGQATQQLLDHVTKTPELRAALNNNPEIAKNAMNRLLRDEEWAAKWGAPRADIQNARRIIAESKNDWIDRLEAAKKAGVISLPALAAIVGSASQLGSAATSGRTGS